MVKVQITGKFVQKDRKIRLRCSDNGCALSEYMQKGYKPFKIKKTRYNLVLTERSAIYN
jgi:hypothetical protein